MQKAFQSDDDCVRAWQQKDQVPQVQIHQGKTADQLFSNHHLEEKLIKDSTGRIEAPRSNPFHQARGNAHERVLLQVVRSFLPVISF
jgi:hypothetical protein